VIGDEPLLVERAVQRAVAAVRDADPAADVRKVPAAGLSAAGLAELLSPSLFGDTRVVVLEGAHEFGKETAEALVGQLAVPADGVSLVVTQAGGASGGKAGRAGNAGKGGAASGPGAIVADALRAAGAEVTECASPTRFDDRVAFVRAEVEAAGGTISRDAVSVLIDAVGTDLRELASAAGQLAADSGGSIDEASVRHYHRGRAEVTGFAVAEKAITGDAAGALEALRWALAVGVAPVLVADALADAVRTVARVGAAGRGDPYRLAGSLGMPPWKVRKAQGQVRGWHPDGLATAMAAVAEVNAEVKGTAADPAYALERAVAKVVAAHRSG
jgi:DNA polymerase-3 subunit delta